MNPSLQGLVFWITGQPATGKTTLAKYLLEALKKQEIVTLWLDSDDLREVLTPKATYTPEDRDRFYASIVHIASLAAQGGVTVVISATASNASYCESLRTKVPKLIEVWLKASPGERRKRDFKGLYKKADAGEITTFPGIDSNYQAPSSPSLTLDTDNAQPKDLVKQLLHWLRQES